MTLPKALIADDSSLIRQLFKKYLSGQFECDWAKSGQEAVELAGQKLLEGGGYTLIMMDQWMPSMNGVEAVKAIRDLEVRQKAKKSMIFLATSDDQLSTESLREAGCEVSGVVIKPILMENIQEIIAKVAKG